MAFEKNPDELGALWIRTNEDGSTRLTGTIDGVGDVVCWPIKSDNPKSPAWRVKRSKPRSEQRQEPVTRPGTQSSDIGW